MSKSNGNKQTILIVGGGTAGVHIARPLSAQLDPAKFRIILVNPRPYTILLPATLRVAVSSRDNIESSILVPYDRLFHKNNGEFIQGSVVSIEQTIGKDEGIVLLDDGQKIPYVFVSCFITTLTVLINPDTPF
jgi:NADH dehydrogenase FAD-containing subunit